MVQIIAGRGFNMCLCNGTGKVTIEHDWGFHFATCPDTNCSFDRQAAIESSQQKMNRILQELDQLEGEQYERQIRHHIG